MSYTAYRNGTITKYDSHDAYIKAKRSFERFPCMEKMVEYLREKTHFQQAGWRHDFLDFYISDYSQDPIYDYITMEEGRQLREYQKELRAKADAAEAARGWRLVDTIYWADNSVEEIWEDKDGIRKSKTVVGPHGDLC